MKFANEIKDINLFRVCFVSLTILRGLSFIINKGGIQFRKSAKSQQK